MPEYKRKKVHTSRRKKAKTEVVKAEIKIPMRRANSKKEDKPKSDTIRVVRGKKGEKKKRIYTLSAIVAVVLITVLILSLSLPVGLFESTQTFVLSLGRGSYPLELSGTATVDCVQEGNHCFVLTDTSIMAFSNGGKKIFSFVHGFSSPVITTSSTRAIVYDQGKNSAVIYNLSGVVKKIDSKEAIITADIAKNGEYALVTKSDSYAGSVKVYNRHSEQIYSINLAKDMINNIEIASSGKKIALSTLSAQSGKLLSSVRIYGFNSADPVFKLDLGEDAVYALKNSGRGFFAVTHNKMRYVNWSKFTTNEYDFDGEVSHTRYSSSGMLVVYNKTNDKSDNLVALFSKFGKKINEFEIKNALSDIRFLLGRVYAMGDSKVTIYDKKGEILGSKECGFGGNKVYVTGASTVCVVGDSDIQRINVNKR